MRNSRNALLLLLVLAAGAFVMTLLDLRQERRETVANATRRADLLVGMLSLYPLHEAEASTRDLLAKTLVEQTGDDVAYLIAVDRDGRRLLELGDFTLRASQGILSGALASGTSARRQFPAPDGNGNILAFTKSLIAHGHEGTISLGLRLRPPPVLSASRASSVATVVFLMLAALIVGYYTIVLSARRWTRTPNTPAGAFPDKAAGRMRPGTDNILLALEQLSRELSAIQAEQHQTLERNAELSSRIGVSAFETQQAFRVLDGLDSGILIVDPQDRIRRVNRTMLGLLGCARAAVENKTYMEALQHEGILQLLDEHGRDSTRQAAVEAQFPNTAPGMSFSLSCRPLLDATGETIGTLLTAEDVTRMTLARSAQEDFIAKVAHELLTPLTTMKTYSEMLMTGDVSDTQMQNEFYNTINGETDRLTHLVRNLLDVSKMETGSFAIERALVRTDELLDQCLPAIEGVAQDKQVTIEKHLPDTFPTLMGDKDMLKVVLVNILGNAVKYTPDRGTIRISLREHDANAFFEISDTGYGIAPEDLAHVFQKFYRGSNSEIRDQMGSGIGLATALQIAKLHGGDITVESEPGNGACFTVRIPTEAYSLEQR